MSSSGINVAQEVELGIPSRKAGGGCGVNTNVGCGSKVMPLDPSVREKVANHPCYSQEAHQYYARMHVAVAPGCNIQCNFCNRKFDCSNESRPGVTSRLLSPEEAANKVRYVANRVPQLSVVGIAGPGDPLANSDRTFRTLGLIAEQTPDLRLCLSTNGLALPDHIDRIVDSGVDHVTVTINMVDPEVGERIYPWVYFEGKRRSGKEAAQILSERQLEGLASLVSKGILCKVNSVMIPGVNDEHLVEVSRVVRSMGVFLHNVMPLVSSPEHGTYFGLNGYRGPSPQELAILQDRCSSGDGQMKVMRHCRQCRADAVGMLGEDRSEEFSGDEALLAPEAYDADERRALHQEIERGREELRAQRESLRIDLGTGYRPNSTVLVAVATKGSGLVNQHFGQAREFWIYEAGERWARFIQTRSVDRYCFGPETCNDDSSPLDRSISLLRDCAAVICSKIGEEPRRALALAGIEAIEAYDLIEKTVAEVGEAIASTNGDRAAV
ncbi:MAG: nitrogenase cofactor biosynthesis protein NifB [Acidimicrobiaceae bacterium]|nr:nitrogenase cofactor biosynthesis protein NifB [Acidimicrobiaceae bacterium]